MDWQNSRVVVTGAGGFIGSHLVERLLDLGADVTAFVRYNSRNDVGLLESISEKKKSLHVVRGELCELETVRNLIKESEVVFHLAALVGIPYSYVHTHETIQTNTIGTLNVLTAAKECKIRKLLVTSTAEVYGSAQYVPIDERHPKRPQSPYAASKVAADALALSFYYAYNLPVAIVRLFNNYGPRQSDRSIIPTLISQALTNDELVVGNLTPTRDFTFVTDTVEGFIRIAESNQTVGEEINLGSGFEVSVGELAKMIMAKLGRDLRVRQTEERMRPEKSEVACLLASNAKAKELANWQPQVNLSEGLTRTIEWIRQHPNYYDPLRYRI